MKQYFLHNGTEQEGPFTLDELKLKNIKGNTPIWYPGLSEWTIAESIPELQTFIMAAPPPFLAKTAMPPAITQNPAPQNIVKIKEKNNVSSWTWLGVGVVVLLIGFAYLGYCYFQQSSNNTGSFVISPQKREMLYPEEYLKTDGHYNENFIGNKLKINGTITNTASVISYKDAVVRVNFYSRTKTKLRYEDHVIDKYFPPTSTIGFELKVDNYDKVASVGWEVIKATPLDGEY